MELKHQYLLVIFLSVKLGEIFSFYASSFQAGLNFRSAKRGIIAALAFLRGQNIYAHRYNEAKWVSTAMGILMEESATQEAALQSKEGCKVVVSIV